MTGNPLALVFGVAAVAAVGIIINVYVRAKKAGGSSSAPPPPAPPAADEEATEDETA
jgi:hypothetical protein